MGSKTKEELLAHLTYRQVVITTLITAVSTIFITLISSGYFRLGDSKKEPEIEKKSETFVHADAVKVELWNDAKDYFIWFNAQYKNASTVHDKNHYLNLMKRQVKFTLILIQPDKEIKKDFANFVDKFHDMRIYLKKAKAFGDEDGYDISRIFPNIYLFREEKIPSMSFFLTKNKEDQDRAIVYIEDKEFIDLNRRPILCLETSDQMLIKKFESRYKELLNNVGQKNRLGFADLVSERPDSTFYIN